MTDTTTAAAEAAPDYSTPPGAAEVLGVSPEPLDVGSTDVRALYDGSYRETHPDARSAAKELSRSRREAGDRDKDGELPDEIGYTDGREPDATVSAKEAAKDINSFRRQRAAEILEHITGLVAAEAEPAEPQPEPTAPEPDPLEAERKKVAEQSEAADKARQTYEDVISSLVAAAHGQNAAAFSDIRTPADLRRVAAEDPARLEQWRIHQDRLIMLQQEQAKFRAEHQQEAARQFEIFAKQQDILAEELVPELRADADPRARAELQQASVQALQSAGFTKEELAAAWDVGATVSLRDARAQAILADAARWRLAQAKAKTAKTKPVPPVQRPGVSEPRSARHYADIQALTSRLNKTGSLRDAAKLLSATRAARRG